MYNRNQRSGDRDDPALATLLYNNLLVGALERFGGPCDSAVAVQYTLASAQGSRPCGLGDVGYRSIHYHARLVLGGLPSPRRAGFDRWLCGGYLYGTVDDGILRARKWLSTAQVDVHGLGWIACSVSPLTIGWMVDGCVRALRVGWLLSSYKRLGREVWCTVNSHMIIRMQPRPDHGLSLQASRSYPEIVCAVGRF